GEHGESWRAEGSRRHKQRGIDDFVAATEWLIGHRYTAADRMVANASSAGGPLVAAAVMQRPELYRAAIFDYSIFDMLRYDRFGHGRQWQSEYGTAADREDFEVLRRYSPYHAVRTGVCYPAILATPGELDQTAPAWHSAKFIAALQAAGSPCGRPALLRMSWGAGHSAGATAAEAARTWADELAFLERVLPDPR
ncbi:MAG: prolyl oligopeptidase family serine peptidase, partial [Gemmatimonadales bacterium]